MTDRREAEGFAGSVAVAVTHRDAEPLLRRCVTSLSELEPQLRVVVFDDASACSFDELLVQCRGIEVRRSTARIGFAANLNRAMNELVEDVVVIFDADAYPLVPFSSQIASQFYSSPGLGLVGIRTVGEVGQATAWHQREPRPIELILGQRLAAAVCRHGDDYADSELCLHTAALAIRRVAFLEIGGADEILDFLDVDLDLSMRMRRAGWGVRRAPELTAFHEGGGSAVSVRQRVVAAHKSRWRLLLKHGRLRVPRIWRTLLITRLWLEWLVARLAGMVPAAARRRLLEVAASRRELLDGRRDFFGLLTHSKTSQ